MLAHVYSYPSMYLKRGSASLLAKLCTHCHSEGAGRQTICHRLSPSGEMNLPEMGRGLLLPICRPPDDILSRLSFHVADSTSAQEV